MKRSIPKMFLLFLTAALLLVILSSCAGADSILIEGAERDQVLAYAEPIADNLFQGMQELDYAVFARDFDPIMKKAMDEKGFREMMRTINPVIGPYQSRQVANVEEVGKYVAVTYTVRYELEEAVSWRVVLTPGDVNQVSGLWYDSTKLRVK